MSGTPERSRGEFPERPGVLLRAAARLYEIAARAHALAWDRGLAAPMRLPVPVISVGNLAVGGTGKTPAVRRIAAGLALRGHRPVVLTRGFGRRSGGLVVLEGAATPLSSRDAGDEPLELAAALPGVPIVVGRDRRAAARRALESFDAGCLVLDDGFQHRPLARDLDIVLLDARRPFGNGALLPAGPLREPPSALARADLLVLTRADRATPEELAATRARLGELAPGAILVSARHDPIGWRHVATGEEGGPNLLAGTPVVVVSGLADNAQFERAVAATGAEPRVALGYPDHYPYGPADLERVRRAAEGGLVVTTEKDLARWRDVEGFGDGAGWWVLVVRFEPAPGDAFDAAIEARLFPPGR